ncbi:unnamed protein product [Zymoseptoria tritici ST99CH_1E4]|uniref:Transcriptional regulator Ngg1 n=1 Tax=Zymoseptoria tritici ST99CH_1E4 TaxID=1276532 RepID=A0A2H1FKJ7_ZYMTR|nr:unnamed protein product [Zymoseptoria tritici ST99CH_1E4]
MAPNASKKGTQSKANSSKVDRRSTSRHSTPGSALTDTAPPTPRTATPSSVTASAATMARETAYLQTSTAALISTEASIEMLIEKSNASVAKAGDPPGARELHVLHDKIRDTVLRFMVKRSEACDRSMRQLVQKRKERAMAEQEWEASRAEEERVKVKREEDERRKEKKNLAKKRSHDEMEVDEESEDRKEQRESLPSVGAHGVARQDGVGVNQGAAAPPSPPVQPGTIVPDLMDTADSPADSDASRNDPPPAAPLYERIFGKDPTAAEDPIVYDIRDLNDEMTYDEKKAILNVTQWPPSDLNDLTAGDPPDMDFSNAKPANQVNFSTFQTYIEPYIRPFTEEDVAFLKERGDRVNPYIIPARGAKGYKEVWAAEDGTTGIEPPQKHVNNPNEARGSIEDLDDDIADQDTVSAGPVGNRLLSMFRPAINEIKKQEPPEDANGDTSMVNGDSDGLDALPNGTATTEDFKPVTCLPADAARPANLPSLDYETFENRALQELRYLGILSPTETPNYDAHEDDEVAARLRTLQHELRRVSRLNNTRKARVLELTEERMAMQEYANIADDLDNQVNAAYLKRNRSLAKPNPKKGGSQARPGQKGVAAVAGRGVSDGVRALMQKRRDWIEMVGPVVGYGRPPIPGPEETIFGDADVKRLEKVEKEAETADVEGE